MIHLTVQQLSAALDGALTGPSLELVVRHLAACHDCRDRQARLAKHDDALRRLLAQDPGEAFLDDLSQRAEAWVLAIARGTPEPLPHASVPLQHEEDPSAPVEPAPPPPRPELGRAGELASEAGFGRIGLKPTASTNAPDSDPEEAQRLMEALERGDMSDFTELTAQGLREHTPVDGPVFDLPAWLQEQSRRAAEPREGPREVPKVNVYFEQLDERAAGLSRAAVNEVFRRDETPATTQASHTDHDDMGLPPGHEAFAPPGWRPSVPAPTPMLRVLHGQGESTLLPLHTPHPALTEPAPGTGYAPLPAPTFDQTLEPAQVTPRARPDRALVMALTSVCGLGLVVLALNMSPNTSTKPGLVMPEVRFRPNDAALETPAVMHGGVQNAATRPPIEQIMPPLVEPDSTSASDADTSAALDEIPPVIPPETTAVEAPVTRATKSTVTPRDTRASKPVESSRITASTNARPASTPTIPVVNAKDDGDWPLLCGVIVDDAGQPIAGARITATEIAFSMRTDAKGRFCLSAPAGTQHLLVESPGFHESREAVRIQTGLPELRLTLTR